jgi:hypothetical protein
MPLERTARGHRFDFESRACVVCGTTHQDFLSRSISRFWGAFSTDAPASRPIRSEEIDDQSTG